MSRPISRLLGFDARVVDSSPFWLPGRRQEHLIKSDVQAPRSVDTGVWPSIFDHANESSRPEWIGPLDPVWENLRALRENLASIAEPFSLIAITLVRAPDKYSLSSVERLSELSTSVVPAWPEAGWDLYGYDVADTSFLSGLSNCGYDAAMRPQMRSAWGGSLNDNHLFNSAHRASEFARVCDDRIAEHAPFLVYGLWNVLPGRE